MYSNVDCLPNKFEELLERLAVSALNPHIITLTEIKHKHKWDVNLAELSIQGYCMFNSVLEDNNRGIITYVRKDLICKQLYLDSSFKECCVVEVQAVNNCKFLVATVYRSPSSTRDNDLAMYKTIELLCSYNTEHLLLLGDFNCPFINWETWSTNSKTNNEFLECLRKNYLYQHVYTPTRARGGDIPHILDLVITKDHFIENIIHESPLGKSDHAVLLIESQIKKAEKAQIDRYALSKGDYNALRSALQIDWATTLLSHNTNIDKMWKVFKDVLQTAIDEHIPLVNNSFQTFKKESWKFPLDKTVRSKISKKHMLWKQYIQTRDYRVFKRYKVVRNAIRKDTRKILKNHQQEVASCVRTNPKKFWNYVNSKRKTKSHIGDLRKVDGNNTLVSSDTEKATVLGEFFSSVFTLESPQQYDNSGQMVHQDSINVQDVINIEFTELSILEKLDKLNTSKSPGPDKIHPRILYELRYELLSPLKIIFEASYKLGKVPDDWKTANVVPVYKKGNKMEPSNYRPISLTSIICKIMESIIRDYIMDYFLDHRFFSDKQFGFIKGRSTVIQLLTILDDWTQQLDLGNQVDVIYTDFEKAFDKVPHQALIWKLRTYGINEQLINWIKDFLCHRTQRVTINGSFSDWFRVLSGIPQGSILGPLLFIIFINDLPKFCNTDEDLGTIYLYADDAKIYNVIKSTEDQQRLQHVINKLKEWCDIWLLKLNVSKCNSVSYYVKDHMHTDYYIYDGLLHQNIEKVNSIKDLGIVFDSKLTFCDHIHEKINKAYSILGIIKRNFIYMDKKTFIMLYKSLVRPHIEYGNSVWHPYKRMDIDEIEKVQKRATKLVISLKKLSYHDRLVQLDLPTAAYRRLRGDMIEVYKILTNKYSTDALPDLRLHAGSVTRGNSYKLLNQRFHYDIRKYSFAPRVVNVWNSLPDAVVNADSLAVFKSTLDKHWYNQAIKYDYRAALTGIGNRSEYCN